ncbi:hypothetical protein GCK72_002788 [Caenorhabditis remanei]|uniref:Uncharacterized protein n=1 Tax=Caenorhabditis remanei TaxID=31234 RepID=A0A6A5HW20_CAERE|nr:hypothetical protein GCK72_002788 [Caenorhabditis remanei]KAF1770964.1 hypothetical protein GCK72_002788 [Caenorhabditis remanei]
MIEKRPVRLFNLRLIWNELISEHKVTKSRGCFYNCLRQEIQPALFQCRDLTIVVISLLFFCTSGKVEETRRDLIPNATFDSEGRITRMQLGTTTLEATHDQMGKMKNRFRRAKEAEREEIERVRRREAIAIRTAPYPDRSKRRRLT